MREGGIKCGDIVSLGRGSEALGAETLRDGGEIRPRPAHAFGRQLPLLLLDINQRKRAIIKDNGDAGRTGFRCGGKLGHAHHQPAIAGKSNGAISGVFQRRSKRGGQRKTHGGKPV